MGEGRLGHRSANPFCLYTIKTSRENTDPLRKRTPEPRLIYHKPTLKVEVEVLEKRKNWDFFQLLLVLLKCSSLGSIGYWLEDNVIWFIRAVHIYTNNAISLFFWFRPFGY